MQLSSRLVQMTSGFSGKPSIMLPCSWQISSGFSGKPSIMLWCSWQISSGFSGKPSITETCSWLVQMTFWETFNHASMQLSSTDQWHAAAGVECLVCLFVHHFLACLCVQDSFRAHYTLNT